MLPRISLVIPAHNEETLLPRLLATVERARMAYHRGADAVQVIVANDGSTDSTEAIAREHGCEVANTDARCIAGSRNAGAALAQGELIAFIDADNQVHPETFNEIERWMSRPDVVGGSSGATMERWSTGIRVAYAMMMPVVWATKFDTGVVFCRRDDFHEAGGFDERLRFAEDVMFLYQLRKVGRRKGQHLVRASRAKAIFSARKFDQFGDWHYVRMLLAAPFYVVSKRAGDVFADKYWYKTGR